MKRSGTLRPTSAVLVRRQKQRERSRNTAPDVRRRTAWRRCRSATPSYRSPVAQPGEWLCRMHSAGSRHRDGVPGPVTVPPSLLPTGPPLFVREMRGVPNDQPHNLTHPRPARRRTPISPSLWPAVPAGPSFVSRRVATAKRMPPTPRSGENHISLHVNALNSRKATTRMREAPRVCVGLTGGTSHGRAPTALSSPSARGWTGRGGATKLTPGRT